LALSPPIKRVVGLRTARKLFRGIAVESRLSLW